MSGGSNKIIMPAAIVAALAAGWVGFGAYQGKAVEEKIKAMVAAPAGRTAIRLVNLNHQGGLLSATGTVDVVYEDTCSPTPTGQQALVKVEYSVSHLPMPGSAARFNWKLVPQGEFNKAFTTLFGDKAQIAGDGSASYGGELKTDLRVPEIAVKDNGSTVNAPASTGHVALGEKTLAVDWKLEKLTGRGEGKALEVKQVALDVNMVNRKLGTGTSSFAIESISAPEGSIEGVKIASEAVERGDRLDVVVHESVRKLVVAGKNLKDLGIDFAIKGLNTKSVELLSKLASDTCGFANMTANENSQARAAARTLLTQGFSVGIPKLTGSADDGSVDGQAIVELLPAKGAANAPIQIAGQLKSNGKVTVKGKLVPQEQKDMLLATGYVTEEGGALSASFDLVDGVLKVTGKAFDPDVVKMALGSIDEQINTLLNGAPAAPAAPAVAPVEAPPAAAPAAPAQAK